MKLTKLYVPVLLMAGMTMGILSCDKKPKEEPEKPMTSVEQKDKVETAALAAIGAVNPEDFQYLIQEVLYVKDNYTDFSMLMPLLMTVQESLQTIDETQKTRVGQDRNSEVKGDMTYMTFNETFRKLYKFSNFTGHFTATDSTWVKSDKKFNDLQFAFKDQNGADCTLTLSTEGNAVPVHFTTSKEYIEYNLDTANKIHTDYYETTVSVVDVPEVLALSLMTGNTEHFCLTLRPDLTGMQSEDFDLSKDSYSFSCSLKVEKYLFDVVKIDYSPGKPAELTMKLSVDNNPAASFSLTSSNLRADNEGLATAKDIAVDIDLMGQVQIKGTCVDALRFTQLIEEAEDNNTNEGSYKSKITQANDLLNLGVYYDGGSLQQARVKLEVFENKGKGYWYCEPVIYFADGTSYTTFDAFFNEVDFADVVEAANNLVGRFYSMVEVSAK